MIHKTGKVFCSYASANHAEVAHFDLALRRYGVPLWRDRTSLAKGALTAEEIEQAAREAIGFTFYLTREAAQSEWVRERERQHAIANAKLDSSFGIVPIFRHDRKEVSELMVKLGMPPNGSTTSPYDLSCYNGYLMRQRAFDEGTEHTEFGAAAETVLRSLLRTKMRQAGVGASLRIGAATRNGPLLHSTALDLIVDWTPEFPPEALRHPNGNVADSNLLKPLHCLSKAIAEEWTPHRGNRFQIVPQCHLSMAIALGYEFRRNTGAELMVTEAQSGEQWRGPRVPLLPDPQAWKFTEQASPHGGNGIAVVIALSRSTFKDAEASVRSQALDIGYFLSLEPAGGPSLAAIPLGSSDSAHRMAVTAANTIANLQSKLGCRPLHLFAAVPAAFAVLLGQQLSNLGPVQTYEWHVADRQYVPTLLLN